MEDMRVSIFRLMLFLGAIIICLLFLYKFRIKESENTPKGLKFLELIFYLFIVSGSLKALYDTKTTDGKIIIIIVLALLINFNNLKYNIKNCNYPSLYKIKLTFRSSIIIIISILTIWYALNNDIYSFLYVKTGYKEDWFSSLFGVSIDNEFGSIDIQDDYNRELSYCPDMRKEDYKKKGTDEYDKWNALTNEKKNNCLTKLITKRERDDVDSGIYA